MTIADIIFDALADENSPSTLLDVDNVKEPMLIELDSQEG